MNNLLSLLQLSDPALPIGGFSHSAGLETYVQNRIVKNKQTAKNFIVAQLSKNIFYTDAAALSLTYDAAKAGDINPILQLDEHCSAVKLPREMREASQKLGLRLLKIFAQVNECGVLAEYRQAVTVKEADGHHCIAFGLIASALAIAKKQALSGFFYNATAGMTTNCVKLIPLGQQDGQEILFSLHPLIEELATKAIMPDKDLLGLCCTGFDIACMQHERLYSRLYMS